MCVRQRERERERDLGNRVDVEIEKRNFQGPRQRKPDSEFRGHFFFFTTLEPTVE